LPQLERAIEHGDGAIDYQSVMRFSADAPHFASASLYRTRIEQALIGEEPGSGAVIAALGGQMPLTADGQIALATAYLQDGQRERAGRIVKEIWTTDPLDPHYEGAILSRFAALLTRDDHWTRAVMLLMHDRATSTERLMRYLSAAQASLANAAIAVARQTSNAARLVDRVDPHYRDHPLFWWIRAQFALDHDNPTRALDMLGEASGALPEPAEWWYARRAIAREALAGRDYRTAYRAAAGYTDGPEGRVVDASFHAGWIALRFLDDPTTAIAHFRTQASFATLPTTASQANYWLGRAYEAAGNGASAQAAYRTAAEFGAQYYGQLARAELGISTVGLRALPAWRGSEFGFNARETVQAVKLLDANGKGLLAGPLVMTIAYAISDPGEYPLVARLAQDIGAHHLAIQIADLADKRGVALDVFAFPKDGLPESYRIANIDRAAVYAVARQESRFDRNAISSSGARGLMQLMPATARETAGKIGVSYSQARLTSDPAYNALLGSTYLANQLERFSGSLVLAAAAYNAGGGNAARWVETFGDPRLARTDPVDWVEMIPFTETRDYVKKVLGNYQVYRARLGDDRIGIEGWLRGI
ncbi:MAG: lytic transglycosylase domain-containing protein, partial [Cucumibacter sp.]